MRTVPIPGGTATFREKGDAMPGRAVKLLKAATVSAMTQLSDYPELFEPPIKVTDPETGAERGETTQERQERLAPKFAGMRLTMDQAMAFDNMREAAAVATIASWTLERPLPKIDTIGDLEQDLYDALLEEGGGMSAAQLEADFNETPERGDDVPTGNSDSSSGPLTTSRGGPEASNQLTTPGSDTAPSSGEAGSPEQ